MSFYFSGAISASKSILNRLLTIGSYSSLLSIRGDSNCDDVLAMKTALPKILAARGEPADCGAAGTTLRFLTLRASRIPGRHVLTGTSELLARPKQELFALIDQLGSSCKLTQQGLVVEGEGWSKPPSTVKIDRSQSSQFASAVLLNAWDLPFDLRLEFCGLAGVAISQGYLDMTSRLVQDAGMSLVANENTVVVGAGSVVKKTKVIAEPDFSSAFAIAAMGALDGEAEFTNLPETSLQPDAIFPDLLLKMGAQVERSANHLRIKKGRSLNAISADLGNCPDLFPVLSVLGSFAKGTTHLFGAPHLAHKESSRIQSTAGLLQKLGCDFELKTDGLKITGSANRNPRSFAFDPLNDHRLAMAASLAIIGGAKIQILQPQVVNKSFPEFWKILGVV